MKKPFDFDVLTRDKEPLKTTLIEHGAFFVSGTAFKCPSHQDNHASAGIFCDDKGHWRYKCQSCDFKGDFDDTLLPMYVKRKVRYFSRFGKRCLMAHLESSSSILQAQNPILHGFYKIIYPIAG